MTLIKIKWNPIVLLIITCTAIIGTHVAYAATDKHPSNNSDPVYRFGVVPQFEQRKLFRIWRPIMDELGRRTGVTFKLVGTPRIPAFEKSFIAGEFDFAYTNPYQIVKSHESQGYIPLVKDTGRTLQGVLVVHKDSKISSIMELDGKPVAFPSAIALGASLLIRYDLKQIHNIEVSPQYVQTHSSVYLHVAKKLMPAGGGVLSTLKSQKSSIRDKLRVIYTTRTVSPHPISVHPRVPVRIRKAVKKAFLAMGESKRGRLLLSRIPIKKVGSARLEDYEDINKMRIDELRQVLR